MSTHEPIRWGLLGTSRINAKLLAGARLSANAEVVAVGSRSMTTAEAYARANGIARVHGSYEALLADPEVDAVYIPLPNSHAPPLDAGRPGRRQARPLREALHAPPGAGR